jgi:hypothetical protein
MAILQTAALGHLATPGVARSLPVPLRPLASGSRMLGPCPPAPTSAASCCTPRRSLPRERDNLPDPPRTTARRQAPFVSVVDLPAYPMTLASHPVRPRSPSRGTFGDRPGSKLGCSILNTRTGIRMRQQSDPVRVTRHDDPAALGLDPVGLDALVCTLRQWHEAGDAGMQLAVYRHGILAIAVACGEDPFSGRPTDTTYCFVSSPPRRPWQQSRCSTSRVRVSSGGAMRSPITGRILHRAVRRLPQFEHLMRTLAVRSARRGAVSMSATETACLVVYQGARAR